MIRWVFLDVGNILLDEDPIAYHCTRLHWEAIRQIDPGLTFLELLAAREDHSMRGSRWPLYDAVSAWLDEAACGEVWNRAEQEIRSRFAELSPVIPGAVELVDRLAPQFRLGLIANQGTECRRWLDALGLLRRFEIVALSEEVGSYKPEPELYRGALRGAGVAPAQCVMIGDRLDNDIVPAAALGMATVWVRWSERSRKGWHCDDPDAIAFRASLQRSSTRSSDHRSGLRPSLVVEHLDAIDSARLVELAPQA